MATLPHDISHVIRHFDVSGEFLRAELCGSGHINDTYFVEFREKRHVKRVVLQRINHHVFKDPVALMANMQLVTSHLQKRLQAMNGSNPERESIRLIPAKDGKSYHQTEDGSFWRCLWFIENSYSLDVATCPEDARQAGRAFARFQKLLSDLEPRQLNETIPFFHHTPTRYKTFLDLLKRDPFGRAAGCKAEIDWALGKEDMVEVVVSRMESGEIPARITHNDTKFNNVLFCEDTNQAVCVTDLDTVMPGTILYDFGDQVRTTTSHAAEDERDLSLVTVDLQMFRGLVEGYLSEASSFITPAEVSLLVFSGRLITFQIGLRFLTDYLNGDQYFKTHRDGHNLDRARSQFALVRSMESMASDMEEIVARTAASPSLDSLPT